MNWTYDPAQYSDQEFQPIPEGLHRIRVENVSEREFSSGNSGFEIVFSASGYSGKIWYYLVLNHADPKATNQRIGRFFDSFGIVDPDMNHYRAWVRKAGAAQIFHEEFNGNKSAKIRYFVTGSKRDNLPLWKEPKGGDSNADAAPDTQTATTAVPEITVPDDDLPFM